MSWQPVYECLNRSSAEIPFAEAAAFHLSPTAMPADIGAVGLDTNALKILRQDTILASSLAAWIASETIPLVVPGQALQEFWNNHRAFIRGSETLERDLQTLSNNVKKIATGTTNDELLERMNEIGEALRAFERVSLEVRDPELFKKSAAVWTELATVATVPHVPRSEFHELGQARFGSKTPPGFEDLDKFPRHLGDFYVWADFLYGLLLAKNAGRLRAGRVIFFTDDAKQDWLTSGRPHPTLAAEMLLLIGQPLQILSPTRISDIVSS